MSSLNTSGLELEREYARGLTWRSLLAVLVGVIVIQPAIIYAYLVGGSGLPVSSWLIILLWSGLCRVLGKTLSRQESFIILTFESLAIGYAWQFVSLLKSSYFATHPLLESLLPGVIIPEWASPSKEALSIIYTTRPFSPFLHEAWIKPITIMLLSLLLYMCIDLCLGLICYQIYVAEEKLVFPAQSASALTLVIVSEGTEARDFRVFVFAIIFGIIYNFLTDFMSFITGIYTFKIFPRGILDLTMYVERMLPGAPITIDFTITPYITGFMLPLRVTIPMFIGSAAFYIIGNYFITINNLWPSEAPWSPGLGWSWIITKSRLYFWTSAIVGLSLATTLIPLIIHPKRTFKIFSSLKKIRGKYAWVILILFLASSSLLAILIHYLVPRFPLWILLLSSTGFSFIAVSFSAYSAGITFGGFNIPYLRELIILSSGYKEFDIWLTPTPFSVGGSGIVGALKQADIVRCRHGDYIKAYLLTVSLGVLASFIYISAFWSLSPFPSYAYPYTVTGWHVEFVDWARWQKWLWTGFLFKQDIVIISFAAGAIVYIVTALLKVPHFLISFVSGTAMYPHTALAQLIGSIINSKVFAKKKIIQPTWIPLIIVGFSLGDSLMYLLSSALTLMGKAQWLLPY
ncbi:MAG: hypothetical protein QW186_07080 [Candidatus Bathyarchaeia archaeon]